MAIYYKFLFHERELITYSEGIVYSALIYKALSNPEFFDNEGNFNIEYAKAFIRDRVNDWRGEILELDLDSVNRSKIAEDTGMSRAAVINSIKSLKKKFLLFNDAVCCPVTLLEENYINLPNDTSLMGQQLVFYGFLKDRASTHEGTLDTWAYRLADLFGIKKANVYHLLAELEHKGYLERLEGNRLRVIEKEPFTGKKRNRQK